MSSQSDRRFLLLVKLPIRKWFWGKVDGLDKGVLAGEVVCISGKGSTTTVHSAVTEL
jgi:hypothetical protein